MKGNMIFLLFGYCEPNSFLYALCFLIAQSTIWTAPAAKKNQANHENQLICTDLFHEDTYMQSYQS